VPRRAAPNLTTLTRLPDTPLPSQIKLGPERALPLIRFRGVVRPIVVAGDRSFVERAVKSAEPYQAALRARGVSGEGGWGGGAGRGVGVLQGAAPWSAPSSQRSPTKQRCARAACRVRGRRGASSRSAGPVWRARRRPRLNHRLALRP
jgi:hypothetical protein